jgi:hypothetical protein
MYYAYAMSLFLLYFDIQYIYCNVLSLCCAALYFMGGRSF